MFKGPVQDIYDLHLAVNNIARKLVRQAQRQKSVMPVASDTEYERLQITEDGAAFRTDRADVMKEARYGGPDQANFLLMQEFINQANRLSGNLDLVGGLGPQARTATQDKMNEQSSSSNVNSLAEDTVNYSSAVIKSLCWFWHNHPTQVQKTVYSPPNLPEISIPLKSYPNDPNAAPPMDGVVRAHSFEDMQIEIDPYSMQSQTPQQKAQLIVGAIQNLTPLAQAQGKGLDFEFVLEKLGEYWDMPDLAEMFKDMPPEMMQQQGGGQPPSGKLPQTERLYTRRSLGGDSQQAREAVISNAMKGSMNGQKTNGTMQP